MKNFDEERQPVRPVEERQFVLRGVTLTVRPRLRPEAMATLEDAGDHVSSLTVLAEVDKGMRMLLVPEDHDKWEAIRQNDDDPVSLDEMMAVTAWVIEVESGRPTMAPSASTDGRDSTSGSSTAPSPSREAIPTT